MSAPADPDESWRLHRVTLAVSAVVIPVLGLVYAGTAPGEVDSLSHRAGFAAAGAALLVAGERSARVRRRAEAAVLALAVLFAAWSAWITALNGFSVGRVVGLFTLQLAGTALFRGSWATALFQFALVAAVGVALAAGSASSVSPALLLAGLGTVAVLSSANATVRERITADLAASRAALARERDHLEDRVR
jgi:hypothetical protein